MSLAESIKELFSQKLFDLLVQIGTIASKQGLKAYAIGGFVRDLLLKKANFDIDIMVEGDAIPFAIEVSEVFKAECKLIERFHTAHLYLPELNIDFSSARKEVYTKPAVLPIISFSNLRDDLLRRDFTINAIAMSITPDKPFEVVDIFNGTKDLKRETIRILHNKSFIDDPTRLYRALRFANRFKFELEEETESLFESAIYEKYPSLLSPKRIATEIDKCFQEERPLTLLTKYQSFGLMEFFHKSFGKNKRPDFTFGTVRPTVTRLSKTYPGISEPAVYWTLLFSKIPFREVAKLLNACGLPHSVVLSITEALNSFNTANEKLVRATSRIDIYNSLHGLNGEAMALFMLSFKEKSISDKIALYLNELHSIKPAIGGKDLIKAGIEPGPQIRKVLDYITEQKVSGLIMTRKDEINLAKRISNL